MWKYKWSKDAAQEFGPFPASHMAAWQQQGCFQATGDQAIWVQLVQPAAGAGSGASSGAAPKATALRELMADLDDSDEEDEDMGGSGGKGTQGNGSGGVPVGQWVHGHDFLHGSR